MKLANTMIFNYRRSQIKMSEGSEFGKGLTYCLGLFLCHAERKRIIPDEERSDLEAELWFNAASDHLYELQIPDNLPELLKERLSKLKAEAIHFGHGFSDPKPKFSDIQRLVNEAKTCLREIDIFFGIPVVKGQWE